MTRSAFVTGGTGFVGLNLIHELNQQGWQVTALHRPSSDLTFLKRFGPSLVEGAITDRDSLNRAIPDGVDTLFHVAGNTNMWRGGDAEQTRDNVEGTQNVVEAALERGVRRLIVTSSISAYGPVSGVVTEATPSQASRSRVNYERTKWQAQEIAKAAVSRGLEVVIMQPGAIMGPYDIGTWSRLFGLVKAGGLPGVPPSNLSFGHVTPIVKAHIAAADTGENGGQYLLAGTPGSFLELITEISILLGKTPPTSTMPAPLLKLVAGLSDFASRFTGKAPDFTPEMAEGLGGQISVPSTRAVAELGYEIVPLKVMIRDCYDWMVAEGRI
jgi:dihydroflavonol-4-reductase